MVKKSYKNIRTKNRKTFKKSDGIFRKFINVSIKEPKSNQIKRGSIQNSAKAITKL